MAGVTDILDKVPSIISGDSSSVLLTLIFFTLVIVVYSVFVYYFYVFLAKKNIIELNLNQYNNYEHSGMVKFFAIIFYIAEYLVLLPVLTFVWFAVLAILILLLANGLEVGTIWLISAALVASVGVTSYVSQTLSKDLAKMLPFTLLAIALTQPGFFVVSSFLSRINEIPSLFSHVPYYLLFIVVVEFIMRILSLIFGAFSVQEKVLKDEGETTAENIND